VPPDHPVPILRLVLLTSSTRSMWPDAEPTSKDKSCRSSLIDPWPRRTGTPRRPRPDGTGASPDAGRWSVLGPHGIRKRRCSLGTSGHHGFEGIAAHGAFGPRTSAAGAAWDRVRAPPPVPPNLITDPHLSSAPPLVGAVPYRDWHGSNRPRAHKAVSVGRMQLRGCASRRLRDEVGDRSYR
jgi:hypothetical protein